jgi:hypothetical protein
MLDLKKQALGSKVTLNLPGHPMHGQIFEVVSRNLRHKYMIARGRETLWGLLQGERAAFHQHAPRGHWSWHDS